LLVSAGAEHRLNNKERL